MYAPALLLFVATQGFGGQPEMPEPDDAPDHHPAEIPADPRSLLPAEGCRVLQADGRWMACGEILELRVPRAAGPDGQAPTAPRAEKPLPVEPDWDRVLDEQLYGKGDNAIKAAVAKVKRREPGPLELLRREVAKMERRTHWLTDESEETPALAPEAERSKAQLAERSHVLGEVEVLALRLRERCIDGLGDPDLQPAERVPVGLRLDTSLDLIQRLMVLPDPLGCERTSLVTAETIARVERLVIVERRLATEKFGYFNVEERRSLEKERDAILDELKGIRRLGPANVSPLQPMKPLPRNAPAPVPVFGE